MPTFSNKILLVTGGTGSFGAAVVDRLINTDIDEIRIFSRDESKQDAMRKHYASEKLKFYIGDVRDYRSVADAVRNVNFVFHAAALKQVPSCEFYPMEAVKTNILGTENVIDASIECCVQRVVCLSTDKAVYPINAMGMTKALMEKVVTAKARICNEKTMICSTRYGNVMASRGSVIPLFIEQVLAGKALTITDPNMTRFMMSLDEAVSLVLYAFESGVGGDIFVQKAPAATIEVLAKALLDLIGFEGNPTNIIGTRHGEKLFETLCSREEMAVAKDEGAYLRISADNRNLNYNEYVEEGSSNVSLYEDYNSHNADRLDVEEMKKLLLQIKQIHDLVAN